LEFSGGLAWAEAGGADMVRVIRDVVALLNRLIQLHYDAIDTCKIAAANLAEPRDRENLARALGDHRDHVDELSGVVRNLGGEPASPGDLRPARGRRSSAPSLSGSSAEIDYALLEAFRRNEEGARAAYEDATSLPGVPLDVLAALERSLADERKHLAWVVDRLSEMPSAERLRVARVADDALPASQRVPGSAVASK
jgi:uncharacterized protein (TIGR02284 family)